MIFQHLFSGLGRFSTAQVSFWRYIYVDDIYAYVDSSLGQIASDSSLKEQALKFSIITKKKKTDFKTILMVKVFYYGKITFKVLF